MDGDYARHSSYGRHCSQITDSQWTYYTTTGFAVVHYNSASYFVEIFKKVQQLSIFGLPGGWSESEGTVRKMGRGSIGSPPPFNSSTYVSRPIVSPERKGDDRPADRS